MDYLGFRTKKFSPPTKCQKSVKICIVLKNIFIPLIGRHREGLFFKPNQKFLPPTLIELAKINLGPNFFTPLIGRHRKCHFVRVLIKKITPQPYR